jgi:hypothetical protein
VFLVTSAFISNGVNNHSSPKTAVTNPLPALPGLWRAIGGPDLLSGLDRGNFEIGSIVTSVEMSGATSNDSPFYKPLLNSTAKAGFRMQEVSADKGYISMKNLQATVDQGAIPFIPFKANTQPDRGTDFGQRCSTSITISALSS